MLCSLLLSCGFSRRQNRYTLPINQSINQSIVDLYSA